MFPYTDKYTESESDIKKKQLLYKIHKACQHAFEYFEKNSKTIIKTKCLFYYLYEFHNPYFVMFAIFVFLGFLYFYFICIGACGGSICDSSLSFEGDIDDGRSSLKTPQKICFANNWVAASSLSRALT